MGTRSWALLIQQAKHKNVINIPKQTGFTLVELVMVMVITGIIGGMVAVFIRAPVQQYTDIARRAEMTDIADTAIRRISRDLRLAVPNSVRVPAAVGATYIEFLPSITGGRYRVNPVGGMGSCAAAGAAGDELSFTAADTCFEILGPDISFSTGDQIVVGSTQADGNPPYQDPTLAVCGEAASTCIRRPVAVAGTGVQERVIMDSLFALPAFAQLLSQRFEVVPGDQQAVTYSCENVGGAVDGTGTLIRYWQYGFNDVQSAPPFVGGFSARLADNISGCSIDYNSDVYSRNGLVTIRLTITRGGENISLYSEIHINNLP
ncbi:MAG: type II secretion system protein [Methylococcaceae bacterium]